MFWHMFCNDMGWPVKMTGHQFICTSNGYQSNMSFCMVTEVPPDILYFLMIFTQKWGNRGGNETFDTLRPRKICSHFAGPIDMKLSLKFVPKVPNDNNDGLVYWRIYGSLSPMPHKPIVQPQWAKTCLDTCINYISISNRVNWINLHFGTTSHTNLLNQDNHFLYIKFYVHKSPCILLTTKLWFKIMSYKQKSTIVSRYHLHHSPVVS